MVYEDLGTVHTPDFDQHHLTGRQLVRPQTVEFNERAREFTIYDPIWGSETIGREPGDEVLVELFGHPALRRLYGLEQLTLPRRYETMPGTTDYSTGEHSWGGVVFVRHLYRKAERQGRVFDPGEKLRKQVQIAIHDVAKWTFGHLGDWYQQGFDGPQTSHDEELKQYLEATGVNEVLQRHGIEPESVIPPLAHDFVESPGPDLCVDRVDWGVREIVRWVDSGPASDWRDAFMIDDQNRLVAKSQQVAREFGIAFSLLATEHHVHPVHRAQLHLLGDLVKATVLEESPMLQGARHMHIIDRLHTIDADILAGTRAYGEYSDIRFWLHRIMLNLARDQREIFALGREAEIAEFVRQSSRPGKVEHFPHPLESLSWQTQDLGLMPPNVEIVPLAADSSTPAAPGVFVVPLPAMKQRFVYPLYRQEDGTIARLGDPGSHDKADQDYRRLIEESRAIQAQAYEARIYLAPAAVEALNSRLAIMRTEWDRQMQRERTEGSRRALAEVVPSLALLALPRHVRTVWQ